MKPGITLGVRFAGSNRVGGISDIKPEDTIFFTEAWADSEGYIEFDETNIIIAKDFYDQLENSEKFKKEVRNRAIEEVRGEFQSIINGQNVAIEILKDQNTKLAQDNEDTQASLNSLLRTIEIKNPEVKK